GLPRAAGAPAAPARGDADAEHRTELLVSTAAAAGDLLLAGFMRTVARRLAGDAEHASPSNGWDRVAAMIGGG
ncbi:MAG: hypothetical protein WD225_10430, partial [Ilumatobacteraceae bacterium]